MHVYIYLRMCTCIYACYVYLHVNFYPIFHKMFYSKLATDIYNKWALPMIIRVAGAVKLQHNVSNKVLEQKVRKLFSNALPSSGWRGMVGRKAGRLATPSKERHSWRSPQEKSCQERHNYGTSPIIDTCLTRSLFAPLKYSNGVRIDHCKHLMFNCQ